GLGLWQHLPVAWGLETLIVVLGLWQYLSVAQLSRGRRTVLIMVMTLISAMTILGQVQSTSAPPPRVMALSSLAFILLVIGAGFWIERPVHQKMQTHSNAMNLDKSPKAC